MKVLVIGRGRVGQALARSAKADAKVEVTSAGRRVASRRVRDADVVVLSVPDEAIETVAATLATNVEPGTSVLHCAGARDLDLLEPCRERGASVGVMHPLVSFPSKRGSPSLSGKTFVLRGEPKAVAAGRKVARACGARAVVAPERIGSAYHAAAALVANGAAALAFVSVGVLERLGFEKRDAEQALGGLLQTVGENVARIGVPEALTGPIARGEPNTVAAHRTALHKNPRALEAYDALIPIIIRCARAAGLSSSDAKAILHTTNGD